MRKSLRRCLQRLRLYSGVKKIRALVSPVNAENINWQRQMLSFYSQFIKKGDLCFDVGANTGKITQIFLMLGAKVVCIEPQEECLRQLHRSFGTNSNVIIVGKAVGEHQGQGELLVSEEANTISTLSDEWTKGRFSKDYKWTKTQTVPVTTLDDLIRHYGLPIFCKIDVEGFEKSVLKGLTKPIPFISFEFTKEFLSETKNCLNHLSSIGYSNFNYTSGDTPRFLCRQWLGFKELYERIDSAEDKLLWGNVYAKSACP